MIKISSSGGDVDILEMEGSVNEIIADLGATVHLVMTLIANTGAKSATDVYIKYGLLARQLTSYIEQTVNHIDEIEKYEKGGSDGD